MINYHLVRGIGRDRMIGWADRDIRASPETAHVE